MLEELAEQAMAVADEEGVMGGSAWPRTELSRSEVSTAPRISGWLGARRGANRRGQERNHLHGTAHVVAGQEGRGHGWGLVETPLGCLGVKR